MDIVGNLGNYPRYQPRDVVAANVTCWVVYPRAELSIGVGEGKTVMRLGMCDGTTWPRAVGVFVGSAAVVVASAITVGTQVAGSPVASAGPKPTATVSGATDPGTGYRWYEELGKPYSAMQDSLQTIVAALDAGGDLSGIREGCRGLRSGSRQFAAVLPAPDSRATFRIEGVVDDLNNAADMCMGFGPGITWEGVQPMMSYIDDANARLRSTQQILAPNG